MLEESRKALLGLGSRVCEPLSAIVAQQPTLSDRAAVILETLPDECLRGLPTEVLYLACVCVCVCVCVYVCACMCVCEQ